MKDISIFDAHCDTILKLMPDGGELFSNSFHVDISRLKKYKSFIQVFALWSDPEYYPDRSLEMFLKMADEFYNQLEKNSEDIRLILTSGDIDRAKAENKIGAILAVEGGEPIKGDTAVLRMMHRLGVRAVTLTWNGANEIGNGVGSGKSDGLTKEGRLVVKEMNNLGIMIDVSHLNEAGFWDVHEISTVPYMASHSNSKSVCGHRRNLTDKQFLAMVDRKCVAGINFCFDFLTDKAFCSSKDIIAHIEHFLALGGEDCIGLGGDFDGIDKTPSDICGVECYDVIDELLRLNYSDTIINKITHGNFERLFKTVLNN